MNDEDYKGESGKSLKLRQRSGGVRGASLLELTVPTVIIRALRAIGSVAVAARTYFGAWFVVT